MATNARETTALIGSDKVEGTDVYNARGEHMGSIERVMIDKRSGQVAYAVLSFGGFLGMGSDYYPVPWAALPSDTTPATGTPTASAARVSSAARSAWHADNSVLASTTGSPWV